MNTNKPAAFEHSSLNPPPPPGSHEKVDGVVHFSQFLFIPASIVSLFAFVLWVTESRESRVISSQSIGRFIGMSGPGGLQDRVVIETDQGYYSIIGAPAISKGTNFVLEVRQSGNRYICDITRDLCVRAAAAEFKRSGPVNTSP